jgi:hypothetical protein
MTTPKSDLPLPARTPAYVDREVGAAELRISPETWDKWVKAGLLPPPAPGFPESTPRWRWEDVDGKLSGKGKAAAKNGGPDGDEFVQAARRLRGGAPKGPRPNAA